jgi:basic membrane protein A
MAISLAACTPAAVTPAETEAPAEPETPAETEAPAEPEAPAAEGLTMETVKVGFIHISDPSDGGYTYNHDKGTQKMKEKLGLRDDQIINKFNISEDAACETAINELIEEGCNIIFATSFGFGDYMLAAAKEHPEVQFAHASGYYAAGSGLKNFHNYFGNIFEARYLSGIAAGLKTKTNKLGYVTAMPFAECISGFTGFYLGAKSVNPDVTMDVMYTNSWNDPTKEGQVAQALIDGGCDVIGQHADSTATQTTAEANGVWGVGYNSDMREAAPNATLTSAVWDWSIYLTMAVEKVVKGEEIPTDFSGGLKEGVVNVSPLNDAIVEAGTAEAIEAAKQKIMNGELKIFAGPLTDVTGQVVVKEGEEFVEPQSAPSWQFILEGINVIG